MTSEPDQFWSLWIAVVTRPVSGLAAVGRATAPVRMGLSALAFVAGIYTVILAVFLIRDYPADAPSALPVSESTQGWAWPAVLRLLSDCVEGGRVWGHAARGS